MSIIFKKLSRILPLQLFLFVKFVYKQNYLPNFRNWRSFNEYMNYIQLYDKNPLRAIFADRLAVREYVRMFAPNLELIKIEWFGTDFTMDVWENLPQQFVLKGAHGSGMVKIVDKSIDQYSSIYELSTNWLKRDYAKETRSEWFYSSLPKILICEKFLNVNNKAPLDFKFFIVGGKLEFIQVDSDRFGNHLRNFYSNTFESLNLSLKYPASKTAISRPPLLESAIKSAESLGKGLPFLRVDLYILENAVYFGEITNTPGAGTEQFIPRSYDFELGNKIANVIK